MKETVLYKYNKDLNATFGEFGGYRMPLWFNSAKEEHLRVLTNVGIFDTSHMALIHLYGNDSTKLLNNSFSRTVSNLDYNRAIYGMFLDDNRWVIDDSIVYRLEKHTYFLVVNSGKADSVIGHLLSFNFKDISIDDYSDKLGKIDVQGPYSLLLLERLYGKELFNDFPYFSCKGSFFNGGVFISRSGYTGEFGFEIFVNSDMAENIWDNLLKVGEDFGVVPCGLAARDSLRVGAVLPLCGHDIGKWPLLNTPWDFAIEKKDYSCDTFTYPYVGFDVRKLHESTGRVFHNNLDIGEVLSCITEVSLERLDNKIISITSVNLPNGFKIKGLVAGFIRVDKFLAEGEIVHLSDDKRVLKVEIINKIRPNRTARLSIKTLRSKYE